MLAYTKLQNLFTPLHAKASNALKGKLIFFFLIYNYLGQDRS